MPKAETRRDPYSAFNFLLEIDGVVVASFSECTALIDEPGPIGYGTGNTDESGTRVPGRREPTMVVLKRGVTANRALWEWRRGVIEGRLQGHTGAIIVLNEAMEPIRRLKFSNGWPYGRPVQITDALPYVATLIALTFARKRFVRILELTAA